MLKRMLMFVPVLMLMFMRMHLDLDLDFALCLPGLLPVLHADLASYPNWFIT
jgi:hypothetical protein